MIPTVAPAADAVCGEDYGMPDASDLKGPSGQCIPWETRREELPQITGDADLVQRVWEEIDGMANSFIWQCLLSF